MLFIKKKVTGDVDEYYAEVHWDRGLNKLHILIYDRDPERTIFGIPVRVIPILERKFQLIEKESDVKYGSCHELYYPPGERMGASASSKTVAGTMGRKHPQ